MKKAISILFALLVLFSGAQLTISSHYCGGMMVDRTVSLTGEIASCEMESCENPGPVQGSRLDVSCCQNMVCMYSVDNHFTPSTSFLTNFYKDNLQIHPPYANISVNTTAILNQTYINEYPPGVLLSTRVALSDICVFRI